MQYTTYLFDLDGTLYDRDRLVRRLAQHQYQEFLPALAHIDEQQFVEQVIALDNHGYLPKDQLYARLGDEWALSKVMQGQLLDHFWDSYNQHHSPPEDTLATLSALKASGKRLGIITNGKTSRQQGKIETLGLQHFFDAVVISEAEGIKKPNPQIFSRALERIGSSAGDTVYIGDHPVNDVNGALDAGLAAIWKRVPYWELTRSGIPSVDRLSDILVL